MKVLVVGATGNLGLRLVPALLTHNHNVVAYVRSSSKLESLLPASIFQRLSLVEGDAKDSTAIKNVILDSGSDAVVNTAGLAALAPWATTDLPEILAAVVRGVREAGEIRGAPLRAWLLGGLGVLYYPGTESMFSNYVPIYLAHRQNIALVRALPPNAVDWSMLCPSNMTPAHHDFSVPTSSSSQAALLLSAGTPPLFQDSWLLHVPFLGRMLATAMNASRYDTTLEQNAEFIANDLESEESRWVGATVGIISPGK